VDGRHGDKPIPRTYLEIPLPLRSGLRQNGEVIGARASCRRMIRKRAKRASIASQRTRGIAHPITPKAGMMGTPVRAARLGPSLAQKRRSFRMTRDKGLWRARVKVMPFQIVSCAVEPFPSRDCPPEQPAGCCRAALGVGGRDVRPHTDAGTLARPHTSSLGGRGRPPLRKSSGPGHPSSTTHHEPRRARTPVLHHANLADEGASPARRMPNKRLGAS
jgi:hypothetical protein